MTKITVLKSPHSEDDPPPWNYSEEAFCTWVHEVFLSGYKRDIPIPSLNDAINIATDFGYTVKLEDNNG